MRVSAPIGAHQTAAADSEHVKSSVDELYRFSLGLDVPTTWRNADYAKRYQVFCEIAEAMTPLWPKIAALAPAPATN